MGIEDMTLLEVANQIGVTKNTLKYKLRKWQISGVYMDSAGKTRMTPDAVEEIRSKLDSDRSNCESMLDPLKINSQTPRDQSEENRNEVNIGSPEIEQIRALQMQIELLQMRLDGNRDTMEALRQTIAAQAATIADQRNQVANLTRLLDQQQILTAQTQNQLTDGNRTVWKRLFGKHS